MKKQLDKILNKLLEHFGADIFTKPNRFRGAILDENIGHNEKKIRFLLCLAICDMMVYTRLLNVSIDNLIEEMHTEYEINKPAAREIITAIARLHGLEENTKKSEKTQNKVSRPSITEAKQIIHEGIRTKGHTTSKNPNKEAPPTASQHILTPAAGSPHINIITTHSKIGDVFHFGGYKWRILKINPNGTALVINFDIVSKMAYHNRRTDITWEKCDLRQFLNNSFYNKFSTGEQNSIVTTEVQNPYNEKWFTQGGANTSDKLFLLSIDEATHLFRTNTDRIAKHERERTWWWLRSPGAKGDHAAFVYSGGNISMDGEASVYTYANHVGLRYVGYRIGGVRPAMVVKLDKLGL